MNKKVREGGPRFFTRFDRPPHVVISMDTSLSRTKQSFKAECDINNIMKRFERTGVLTDMIKQNPAYGDFSEVPDYLEALNIVAHAHTQFESLSAKVRARFNNDPEQFLAFVSDPRNRKEMVDMGLAIKREPKAPDNAVPAPQAPRQEAPKEPEKVPPK